jgi:hypothetical protein
MSKGCDEMSYISPDLVAQVKQIDLLTYLQTREPDELVHVAGKEYSTKTHDSLKISNGLWAWNSRGIGGRSALDYLIKVRNMGFLEAVDHLLGQVAITPPASFLPPKPAPKKLLLPAAAPNNDKAIAYLTGRGILRALLDDCVAQKLLYQSKDYAKCVFVGLDRQGKPRYAALRGTAGSFKGEAPGSDKRFAFSLPCDGSQELHLFESAIDLLSFVTLYPAARQTHLLSLAGVYAQSKVVGQRLPVALVRYLEDYPCVKQIALHLDNDRAGLLAAQNIVTLLAMKYDVRDCPPSFGKDVNDELRHSLGLAQERWKERQVR